MTCPNCERLAREVEYWKAAYQAILIGATPPSEHGAGAFVKRDTLPVGGSKTVTVTYKHVGARKPMPYPLEE